MTKTEFCQPKSSYEKNLVFGSIDCIKYFHPTGIPRKWRDTAPFTPHNQRFENHKFSLEAIVVSEIGIGC